MTSVEELIKKDAKRQLLAGTVLSILAVLFLVELFWYRSVSIAFMGLYSFAFTLGGIGLLRTGFVDWKKAKKTDMHVKADETSLTIERVPGRMYVGQKTLDSAHAVLVDMDGAVYAEAEERKLGKYPLWRKLSVLLSVSDIRSFECEVTDREGNLLYTMEKKGGFAWRGYVQNHAGEYVAYTKETKDRESGKRTIVYVGTDNKRWTAEGDAFIGHFLVKDQAGKEWAMIKRGAIPSEAADRFEKMPGCLIEWKERGKIPASLIAFLFLMNTRER
ncbi:hypothetical protein QRD89_14160 [Halobacillus sp. ACCC02827]|uniref:hypothetical protein n=1 Tax=Bacillaceae TaxID=186817 RepID=UPI0002A4CF14|nr:MULTISPECIES: hypothetical protein [Bacillaceae]ELK47969.1 hypothetical protein D479_04403 [Halobacillus sp. BAB-2008]QHT47619.1 hypothetical protein M662_14375 [Bacillus sp. SB49]WJE14853.1 hypothetical protein QRD89_14160 [Halobacillus sp. ACCC02827]